MKITPINGFGSYGVFVDDVDFENITEEEWIELGKLNTKTLVTIIRNAKFDPKKMSEFMDKWGPKRYSGLLTISKFYPDVPIKRIIELGLRNKEPISQEHCTVIQERFKTRSPGGSQRVTDQKDKNGGTTGMFPDGELYWHSNEAANLIFAPGVCLYGQENMKGSSTGFLQTADYYEDISESFRSELDNMVVIHKWQDGKIHESIHQTQEKLMQLSMNPDEVARIPMVIQSPGGIKGLHYSINTVWGIEGMNKAESDKLFERLNKELMTEKYVYDYWYENDNDWLFFDNSITNHRRLGQVKNRLAYRIQHGYDHVQVDNYNPYLQEEFATEYNVRLNELQNFMVSNFNV